MKTSASPLLNKQNLVAALRAFINQRSGIDYANYGERESFMGDHRPILKHGKHARQLLRAVELRDSITAEMLIEATSAFSGRLQFVEKDGKVAVDYTTGQYFPTEYRNAACAVLARALWYYFRANMPKPDGKVKRGFGKGPFAGQSEHDSYNGLTAGEYIRKQARNEFGRAIASTWFN